MHDEDDVLGPIDRSKATIELLNHVLLKLLPEYEFIWCSAWNICTLDLPVTVAIHRFVLCRVALTMDVFAQGVELSKHRPLPMTVSSTILA